MAFEKFVGLSSVLGLVVTLAVTSASAESFGWSRFRGDSAMGQAESGKVPATWSESENLRWKTELPGRGSSSPVVMGNRVYLTAYTGYGLSIEEPGNREDLRLHVLAISLDDGKIIWDHEVSPSVEEQILAKRVAEHGYASPTPCVDATGVYAGFGPSGLVALTLDGKPKWRKGYGTKTVGFGAAASPILHDELVIMNGSIESGIIYAFDKATGELKWQAEGIDKAWTTPTMVTLNNGQHELVVNQKNAIVGLDPANGEKLWTCDGIEDYVVPCVLADGETLYCSGGRSNRTFCIRAGGRGDVTESHTVWMERSGANVTTPILDDGYLYWSHDKALALCLRASDGKEMFRERLPTRGRVYGSIVGDGEKLFLTTRDSGVLVIAAKPEYEELATNRLGSEDERFNATPAIVGGQMLLRSDRALYCIGK